MDLVNRYLSPNFQLAEFLRSELAPRHGIDMTPPPDVVSNLGRLANTVLESLRDKFARPVVISSGYRPLALNDLVRGAQSSDHLTGSAADFHVVGMDLAAAWDIAQEAIESLPVKQLIREYGQWIHVSVEPYGVIPHRQVMIKSGRIAS